MELTDGPNWKAKCIHCSTVLALQEEGLKEMREHLRAHQQPPYYLAEVITHFTEID